jgi:hypothetical protein
MKSRETRMCLPAGMSRVSMLPKSNDVDDGEKVLLRGQMEIVIFVIMMKET